MNEAIRTLRQMGEELERLSMIDGGLEYQRALREIHYWARDAQVWLELKRDHQSVSTEAWVAGGKVVGE